MVTWFWVTVYSFFLPWIVPARAEAPVPAPDLGRVVAVIGPRSSAQGCPVGPREAITAGHVAAATNALGQARLQAYRGENSEWAGYLEAQMASDYEDAGLLRVAEGHPDFPSWYTVAGKAPALGERLWWVGYDWRKQKTAYQPQVFSAKVVTIRAGNIVLDTQAIPGSSGSCVLNAQGQVVGLLVWGHEMNDARGTAVVVGLWPPWFNGVK
jgi:V8-like Glu-specific endopeptidase